MPGELRAIFAKKVVNSFNGQKKFMKKGFTLIELLVVIAIIGILASIVLVAFPGATKKAKDSRVVSAIAQARTTMAYVYDNDGTYENFDEDYPEEMVNLWADINDNDKEGTTPDINQGASGACIYATLSAKDNYWYCADSEGKAGFTSTDPATADCVGESYVCPSDVSG